MFYKTKNELRSQPGKNSNQEKNGKRIRKGLLDSSKGAEESKGGRSWWDLMLQVCQGMCKDLKGKLKIIQPSMVKFIC